MNYFRDSGNDKHPRPGWVAYLIAAAVLGLAAAGIGVLSLATG